MSLSRSGRGDRSGYVLIDALVGLAMLVLVLYGLGQLRQLQLRTVESARSRLVATEAAAALALVASLDPALARDPDRVKQLAQKLDLTRSLRDGQASIESRPIGRGIVSVTGRVRYVHADRAAMQEVEAVAAAR